MEAQQMTPLCPHSIYLDFTSLLKWVFHCSPSSLFWTGAESPRSQTLPALAMSHHFLKWWRGGVKVHRSLDGGRGPSRDIFKGSHALGLTIYFHLFRGRPVSESLDILGQSVGSNKEVHHLQAREALCQDSICPLSLYMNPSSKCSW